MGKPNKLSAVLRDADLYLACLSLAVLIVLTVSGVAMRYLVKRPLGWMEEVQLWSFLWTVFFGAGAVARNGGHIAIDAFIGLFPRVLRSLARGICQIVTIAVVGFFGFYAWKLVVQMYNTERTTNILEIPYYIIYAAVPLSCLIMVLVAAGNLIFPPKETNAVQAAIEEAENA